MAAEYDHFIDQGSDYYSDVSVDGVDLTNATIVATIKPSYTSATSFQFDIIPFHPELGNVRISLPASRSLTMKPGRYVYDVKYTLNSVTTRIVEGIVTLNPSVS